ncbi:leucine-rich repeat-containing protein 71 isoform X1 [Fundulus heteroclitus]|uniref:leucine-rich repeat-containing protein 71 isoform X1 n=1 Tax=Fundulus heteroclitus TaxID=8078 RepID=UPI00165A49E4|nr:leucine-rich repeat-containing protein 71 isoform X1 [Fundulus heteroclitus]
MSRKKQQKPKINQEEEEPKNTGSSPNEELPVQTFDNYQCTGNVEIDFPLLCALLNMKEIPAVNTKHLASSTDGTEGVREDDHSQISASLLWSKPCLNIELENEDPLSAKRMRISGWKVNEQIFRAMQKMLPSITQLQSLQFWQARLTDPTVISLMSTAGLCSNLRAVSLEGNPLPEQSFHLLLSEDSNLTHLSLRNNRIGEEGARLIGSALSTTKSANKNLLSLNLAFNNVGDAGAAHIAQGLRLNRTLLFLSLSNNQIGDSGAARLAATLGEFALTHEEVVERRKLLLQRVQASSLRADLEQTSTGQLSSVHGASNRGENKDTSRKKKAAKKEEKTTEIKEKPQKKTLDGKGTNSRGGKSGGRGKHSSALEDKSSSNLNEPENMETGIPLLDSSVYRKDGQLFLPGNTTLSSLNLAGNRITENALPLFLASLEKQEEAGGNLQRLCLQRNLFPEDSECYKKINEMKALGDPLVESISEEVEEEGKGM